MPQRNFGIGQLFVNGVFDGSLFALLVLPGFSPGRGGFLGVRPDVVCGM